MECLVMGCRQVSRRDRLLIKRKVFRDSLYRPLSIAKVCESLNSFKREKPFFFSVFIYFSLIEKSPKMGNGNWNCVLINAAHKGVFLEVFLSPKTLFFFFSIFSWIKFSSSGIFWANFTKFDNKNGRFRK